MAKRHLPPLNALRIFETAARARSLSEAARELGLTHGAVSRQIQLLEDWLGQPLFQKHGQRSVATDHARAFAAEISAAFDRIGDAAIRFGKTPHTRVLRINAQTTFAVRWLIPRLQGFHEKHPDIEIAVATSNTGDAAQGQRVDVLIRREPLDRPEWRHFDALPLFEEQLRLVAAPDFVARTGLNQLDDLRQVSFVTSETRVGEWERWLEALGIADLRPARFRRFDHYHVAVQAVIDGLGVGIGGFPTLGNELAQGRLVTPFPGSAKGATYVALVPKDADKTQALQCFLAWLQAEGAATGTA
ncbi:LysR substrate-binding domain-containing protein [Propionivibrio dicarboxylicus]|uniref:DNA-binding transcriptional regulator, LysR family n=1 Tax=Propionivibrio dicarboxylicus TaxID=83767 RepID=A0A1G7WBB1_9RHOO|nr:LysR substrate-binding domain-containing protein [Propionivibrio dicarboxylicus]SDG69287.1 DNA-binding transcriptional regulator, LysR family [Propionivibrio dicarboxylicus]